MSSQWIREKSESNENTNKIQPRTAADEQPQSRSLGCHLGDCIGFGIKGIMIKVLNDSQNINLFIEIKLSEEQPAMSFYDSRISIKAYFQVN